MSRRDFAWEKLMEANFGREETRDLSKRLGLDFYLFNGHILVEDGGAMANGACQDAKDYVVGWSVVDTEWGKASCRMATKQEVELWELI